MRVGGESSGGGRGGPCGLIGGLMLFKEGDVLGHAILEDVEAGFIEGLGGQAVLVGDNDVDDDVADILAEGIGALVWTLGGAHGRQRDGGGAGRSGLGGVGDGGGGGLGPERRSDE